jgi:hypothetical protein
MRKFITGLSVTLALSASAQDSTLKEKVMPLAFNGYVEAYYAYDFNKPADNVRPFFFYSHNKHNEFDINLAFVKVSYTSETVRANIALAAGTYVNANYAAEPGMLKNLFEANAGVKISKTKNLWVDAGIFPSHIGFENAQSSTCWTLTRSILADNSPYYESGAKITYTSANGKWFLSGMALNGWQRIQRIPGNSLMSWGTQVQVKPSDKILFNYSTFIGTDTPDSTRLWRRFHNLYAVFQFNAQWGLTTGIDIGTQQASKVSGSLNTWYSPVAILRYTPSGNWAIAVRGEYYRDKHGVIIATGTANGFKTWGASINVDRLVGKNFWWRTEIRTLHSQDAIFMKDSIAVDNDTFIVSSLAVSF